MSVAPDLLLLTLEEVAARLRVSRTTVRRLRESGDLPSILIGRRCVRFEAGVVEGYIRGERWGFGSGRTRKADDATRSSLRSVEVVFSDGSRPARRKSRRASLKLVSATNTSTRR